MRTRSTVIAFGATSLGNLAVFADGSFTYTPNAGASGAEVVSYTISDGFEVANAQLTINIAPEFDCPLLVANMGDSCDDGNAGTTNDTVDATCVCMGTPVGSCTGTEVELLITTDANGADVTWAIIDDMLITVASGGPYPTQNNTTISEVVCLPTNLSSCFGLYLYDSHGRWHLLQLRQRQLAPAQHERTDHHPGQRGVRHTKPRAPLLPALDT